MGSNRGRAKQLEKKRRKRSQARQQTTTTHARFADSAILRQGAEFPVYKAYLSRSWREVEGPPGLVTAVLTRKSPAGLIVATALVDRTYLGVKDGFAKIQTEYELNQMLDRLVDSGSPMEEVEPNICRSVVYHAVDYARSLGFKPHPDFPANIFGPRPEVLLETPLAHPKQPYYIQGPYDDPVIGSAAMLGGVPAIIKAPLAIEEELGIRARDDDEQALLEALDDLRDALDGGEDIEELEKDFLSEFESDPRAAALLGGLYGRRGLIDKAVHLMESAARKMPAKQGDALRKMISKAVQKSSR